MYRKFAASGKSVRGAIGALPALSRACAATTVGKRAELRDFLPQRRQLVLRRECATPQQVRGCFEADAPGQLLELIATNDELARQTIDVAEPGLRRDDPVQTARLYRGADETAFTSW